MILPRTMHVLILSERESAMSVDKAVLRRLGVSRLHHCVSGDQALLYIAGKAKGEDGVMPVTFVVCDERLSDMNSLAFLLRLRSCSGIENTPLLLMAGGKESALAKTVRAAGGCSLLARPYTQQEAEAAIVQAHMPKFRAAPQTFLLAGAAQYANNAVRQAGPARGALRAKPQNFAPATPGGKVAPVTADGFFQQGFAAMRAGNIHVAEQALRNAFALDPLHAEACLALSRLYASLEKDGESWEWLCRAGTACLRRHEPDKAREFFSRLPKSGGAAVLAREASRMLHEKELRVAALTFLEAQGMEDRSPLHAMISRACMFTEAPEITLKKLCAAFVQAGYETVAQKLQQRLMPGLIPAVTEEPENFWQKIPVLSDIVAVASYTFASWRQAA